MSRPAPSRPLRPQRPATLVGDLRGALRLSVEGVHGVTRIAEGLHGNILRLAPPLGQVQERPTRGITGLVYRAVRGGASVVGGGVEVVLGCKPTRFEADAVVFEDRRVASDLTLFMPGLTGAAWLDATPLPRSPGGFVQGDARCRVAGLDATYVAGDGGSFPGPDWMPKQAHQADLQAEVAARNLLRELRGERPEETFRVELVCIIDTLERGLLVTRHEGGGRALPPLRAMHWAKALFEKRYLRRYR